MNKFDIIETIEVFGPILLTPLAFFVVPFMVIFGVLTAFNLAGFLFCV